MQAGGAPYLDFLAPGIPAQSVLGAGLLSTLLLIIARIMQLMLSATREPVFGPVMTVGLGGIFVDVLGDVVHRLVPLSAKDALVMPRKLKGWKLLERARAQAPATDLGEQVAKIDVNPVVVGPIGSGVRIVDALVVRRAPA